MNLTELLTNTVLKSKQKAKALFDALQKTNAKSVNLLIDYAKNASPREQSICLEALEHLTKTHPKSVDANAFRFAIDALSSENNAVQREAGRIIANTAASHPELSDKAIKPLLVNAENESTVVRWSAASALSAIAKSNSAAKKSFTAKIKKLYATEADSGVKKIYAKLLE